jgi:hypothetical protein
MLSCAVPSTSHPDIANCFGAHSEEPCDNSGTDSDALGLCCRTAGISESEDVYHLITREDSSSSTIAGCLERARLIHAVEKCFLWSVLHGTFVFVLWNFVFSTRIKEMAGW